MANQPSPSRPWRLQLGHSLRPVPMAESPAQPQPQLQPQPPASRPIFPSKFGKPADTLPQQPPEPSPQAIALPRFRLGNGSSVPANPSQKTTPPPEKIKPITLEPTEQKTFLTQKPADTLPQQPPVPSPQAIALPRFRFGNASSVPANPSQKTTPAPEKIKPITLEPTEQKTLLTQKPNPSTGVLQKEVGHSEKPSVVVPGEKKREEAKDHKGNHKKVDSKDCGMLIITVAGDSKGATAELSASRKEPGTPLSFVNAFINSNVQTISNSIMLDASVTDHNPGVHVFIPRGDGKKK